MGLETNIDPVAEKTKPACLANGVLFDSTKS